MIFTKSFQLQQPLHAMQYPITADLIAVVSINHINKSRNYVTQCEKCLVSFGLVSLNPGVSLEKKKYNVRLNLCCFLLINKYIEMQKVMMMQLGQERKL